MNWLLRQLQGLFSWLWDGIANLFRWFLDSLGSVFTWFANHVQSVAVLLIASLGSVMPSETLQETWNSVLGTVSWITPNAYYILSNFLAFDQCLARITYFGIIVLATYAVRAVFASVRALLDLL